MTIPKFDQLSGSESLPELIEMVAKLQKQVQWLMDGKLGDDNIRANSITAVKMDVEQLSAITADMGKITAGEIYGAYIATGEGSYPRAELSSASNLFGAYLDPSNSITIVPNYSGLPGVVITRGGVVIGRIWSSTNGRLNVTGTTDLYLEASDGSVNLNAFGGVNVNGTNIEAELNSKATSGASTGAAGTHNHGIPDGTQLAIAGGGTVTWVSAANHSHTQT